MRRHPATRFLAALLGVWFTITMVEPVALHACPMHDGHGVHGPLAEPAPEAAHHAHHDQGDAGVNAPQPSPKTPAGCLCVGDCAGATPAVTGVVPAVVAVEVTAPAATLPPLPAHAPVTRGGLVLPFGNGPPEHA